MTLLVGGDSDYDEISTITSTASETVPRSRGHSSVRK